MPDMATLIRQKLKSCNLRSLFIEDLGWNHHRAAPLVIQIDGAAYILNVLAEKHGMVAYECQPGPHGQIPDYATRSKIERQAAKSAHEHIIVFINADKSIQTWQWVRREKGRPAARREHTYVCGQPGDSLIQKLQNLMVSIQEEDSLTILDVTGKVKKAFDLDRVTKRFYDRFKDEHKAFLSFIEGVTAVADREWYASLMLNRLMFIYFIQKKKFLDGDPNYLRNRLQMVRAEKGRGKFHSFYRYFLLRLFREGLGKKDHPPEIERLMGKVPYLNGGLFDEHQLEQANPDIQIPDEAFEALFDFFDAYQWHLDERPTRSDNEINPDVLGYIFEKYINQKQMGAYYTKEDITEYISKSTIVPFLFDAAEKKCAIAFRPDGGVWRLLRDDPDLYIYEAVKKGVDLPLPVDIAAGVADVSKRGGWNRPADDEFALPTETWREHMARRTRCLEMRAKLAGGEIHNINDLITNNLDLRQFAQDVIETCEGPDLLRAFYKSIAELSALDPTCGSGAFLFAALNVLEPLYEACLNRMEGFVEELDKSGEKHHPEKYSDFRKVLDQANDTSKHPSRRYFILKSIVLKNLYGVDIMPEAVEICKLRLFLKLVAQVESVDDIEPLPDIDFNIRAGNTLIGFTSLDSVKHAMTMSPDGSYRMLMPEDEDALRRIDESSELADKAFRRFREQQTTFGMQAEQYFTTKSELQTRLAALRTELDRYTGTEYGIDLRKSADFERWRGRHQPFHWLVEFYGIMNKGGFDVIIGNPPYLEYSQLRTTYSLKGYRTESCGNLYAFVIERGYSLLGANGRHSMIVQLPLMCTDRMIPLQKECIGQSDSTWFASFDDRPARLFDGLEHIRATIFVAKKGTTGGVIHATSYNRWYSDARSSLFETLSYSDVSGYIMNGSIPKIGNNHEKAIRRRLANFGVLGRSLMEHSGNPVYYHNAPQYWIRAMDYEPYFWNEREGSKLSTQVKALYAATLDSPAIVSVLNSSLFYWWFVTLSDCRHLNLREIACFPIGLETMPVITKQRLADMASKVMSDYKLKARRKEAYYKTTGKVIYDEFYPSLSKSLLDDVDRILAEHYGFKDEEMDFLINYSIKYRMGKDSGEDDE